MGALQEITTDFSAGNKTSGTDFFTDVTADFTGTITFAVVVGTACVVKYTQNGTDFFALNSNSNIAADSWYIFTLPVKLGDTVNLNQSTGTVNIKACRLYK